MTPLYLTGIASCVLIVVGLGWLLREKLVNLQREAWIEGFHSGKRISAIDTYRGIIWRLEKLKTPDAETRDLEATLRLEMKALEKQDYEIPWVPNYTTPTIVVGVIGVMVLGQIMTLLWNLIRGFPALL